MDEATGVERAELIGWILGDEWRVYWSGTGVTVEPSSASKRMIKDCPCMQYHLAARPDATYICDLIDERMRQLGHSIEIIDTRTEYTYSVTYNTKPPEYGELTGGMARKIDVRLEAVRMLKEFSEAKDG